MLLQVGNIRIPVSVALCAPPSPVGSLPEGVPEGKELHEAPGGEEEEEKIPHATAEVYRHTLLRGANVGSLFALVFGVPVLFFRGVRQPAEMMRRLAAATTKGVGVGTGLVALLTLYKLHDQTEEQVYDRAYRLRYNKGQCRMDKVTYGSVLAGGLAGMAAMPGAMAVGGLQGACVGAGLAVFIHGLTSRKPRED